MRYFIFLSLFFFSVSLSSQNVWYVAPDGSSSGDGSISNPWNIATMFAAPSTVQPGDTILLRGGIYHGHWYNNLTGTSSAYITVKSYPGEMAVLDVFENNIFDDNVTYTIYDIGAYTIFRDFMITNTGGYRFTMIEGSNPLNWAQPSGIELHGEGSKCINLIIHNTTAKAIGTWADNPGGEIYGCLAFQYGWVSTDRGHGYFIYTQNYEDDPFKIIENNIFFKGVHLGMKAYGEHGKVYNYKINRNINFMNGAIGYEPESGIFIGTKGYDYPGAKNIYLKNNSIYLTDDNRKSALELGYYSYSKHFEVIGNTLRGGYSTIRVKDVDSISRIDSNFVSATYADVSIAFDEEVGEGYNGFVSWDHNTYFQNPDTPLGFALDNDDAYKSFSDWQTDHSFDLKSTYSKTYPTSNVVNIYNNKYEDKRGHLAVFNFEGKDNISVDISSLGFQPGDSVIIYDVENLVDQNILKKIIYDGSSIDIPMTMTECIPSPKTYYKPLVHSDKYFNAFLITDHSLNIPVIHYVSDDPNCEITIDTIIIDGPFVTVSFSREGRDCSAPVTLQVLRQHGDNYAGTLYYEDLDVSSGVSFNMLNVAPDAGSDDFILRLIGDSSFVEKSFYYETVRPFEMVNATIREEDNLIVTHHFNPNNGDDEYGYLYDSKGNQLGDPEHHISITGMNTLYYRYYQDQTIEAQLLKMVIENKTTGDKDSVELNKTLDAFNYLHIYDWSYNTDREKTELYYYRGQNYNDTLRIFDSSGTLLFWEETFDYKGNNKRIINMNFVPDDTYMVVLSDGYTADTAYFNKVSPPNMHIIGCYPDPTPDVTVVVFSAPDDANVTVTVKNTAGDEVKEMAYDALKGNNNVDVDLYDLNEGEYMIYVSDGTTTDSSSVYKIGIPSLIRNEKYDSKGLKIIDISPNPAKDKIRIRFISSISGNVELSLFNINGTVVTKKVLPVSKGSESDMLIDLTGNPDGLYIVLLRNGESFVSGKIVLKNNYY